MRRFFKAIFWLFAATGFLVVALAIVGVYAAFQYRDSRQAADLPDEIVLAIDLNQPILEKPRQDFFGNPEGIQLRQVVMALERAKDDPRVKGVIARIGDMPLGFAQAQEIAGAVSRFRASGKFTIAHAEDLGSGWNGTIDYMAAAAFEELWLQPTGGLGLTGLAFEMPYARQAFEKISIQPEFEQRHEFKGGADPFTEDSMSSAVRRNLTRMLAGWTELIDSGLSAAGRIEAGTIRRVFDDGPYLAEQAKAAGYVDVLGYWDEAETSLDSRVSENAELVDPDEYLAGLALEVEADAPKIALIYGVGAIMPDGGGGLFDDEGFGPYAMADAIAEAREDDGIEAVIIRLNSPGGAYGPSDVVWREVRKLRDSSKPVVVVMGDIAASGGYFVAMDGNYVLASSGTLTGSIGVYAGRFASEALWNRIGVNWETVSIGRNVGLWSGIGALSDSERAKFAESVDFVYRDFTDKVQRARNLTNGEVDAAARGRIWTGRDALRLGLIDSVGGWRRAVEIAKELAGIDPDARIQLVDLPEPMKPYERIEAWLENGDPFAAVTYSLLAVLRDRANSNRTMSLADRLLALEPAGMLQAPPFRLVR